MSVYLGLLAVTAPRRPIVLSAWQSTDFLADTALDPMKGIVTGVGLALLMFWIPLALLVMRFRS